MSEGLAFKSFVSESELDEKRKKRQEEWDKVRTADQPEECPEEEYDNRSLYEKLQEQKDKKQAEYDDSHQFKNMVRGLDDDESKFLDEVAERQMELDLRKRKEEKEIMQEVEEYKNSVLSVNESASSSSAAAASKTTKEPKKSIDTGAGKKKSQAALLAGAVKRKKSESAEESAAKKSKADTDATSSSTNNTSDSAPQSTSTSTIQTPSVKNGTVKQGSEVGDDRSKRAQVVAVLPGLGHYANSDDSDTSESEEDSELDLTGPLVSYSGIKKVKKFVAH